MKRILLLLSLICSLSFTYANECAGWNVRQTQSSVTLCTSQTLDFDVVITHDSLTLDSCKYEWYIKSPVSSSHIMFSSSKSTSYAFSDFGDYWIYAKVTPNACPSVHTDTIVITRHIDLTPGTIDGSDIICHNSTPSPLKQVVPPTGGNGVYTYQWQQKSATSWLDISGATSTSYSPSALTNTTTYRLKVTNDCGVVYSNEQTITVRPALTAPVVSNHNETICYGTMPTLLSITTLASGGDDDDFTYQWQESTNGQTFIDIVGATQTTYQPEALTADHYYRVIATSLQGCGSIYSSNVAKVSVLKDLVISTTDVPPLCYMSRGTIKVSATGAGDNYTYQWQESTDGIAFADCSSNATASTYLTTPKTAGNYYYRCIVTPTFGCTPKTSEIISVVVYDDITPGIIVGTDTICYNTKPSALVQTISPIGGNGVYTYQWQQKSATSWLDISGATSTSYSPSALTNTTTYRLKITNDCGIVYSNEQTITVRPALSAPIVSNLNETICYGTAPSPLSIVTPAYGGDDDTFTYQWQESKDGISFSNISGATGLSYQPNALVADHYYRVAATSVCGCGSIYSSNITKISVLKDLSISTTGVAPLCYMSRGDIKVTATGAGDDYTYQWQESTDGLMFTDCVSNSNSATYKTPPSSAGTYYYRCIVTPTYGCASKTSDVITVVVYNDVIPSVITGADTICYGFTPEALTVEVPASGGNNVFTYAWMQKVEGTSIFTYIAGANKTTYQPSALTKTTEYKLEITNACGIYESNTIQIYVRDQLTAPIIVGETDTICYNTTPELMTCTQTAIGGVDDSFVYQWQESKDGQSYTDIQGETNLTYQPDALLAKRYYRLQATSDKQCGILYSNVIEVNVFDSLHITASVISPICYMTSASLSVNVEGGGSPYAYQWQQSTDGVSFTDITDGVSSYHITPSLPDGTYYYRCVVTSTKCGVYSRISNVVSVDVYEALSPGTITGIDSTCYGYAPDGELRIKTAPTGVDGRYAYRWQQRTSGNWDTIPNAVTSTYSPPALYETTEYRLQVSTQCDTSYTNTILVRVNALPETQEISGATEVCYNQHEIYSIDDLHKGYTYQWYVDNNYGTVTTESLNTKSVDILWNDPRKQDSVVLVIINNKTGCERTIKYGVNICNEQAPDRTIVVRKPNSDILLCKEDRDLYYQWGYTDKYTQTSYVIDDSNRRYVLLPSSFDNYDYDYWLLLRYKENSKCYSKSYYSPENDEQITSPTNKVSVPTLVKGYVPIEVHNTTCDKVNIELYTISGLLYGSYTLGNESYINTTLPIELVSGLYIMHVQVGDMVETIKLIAQ